MLTKIMVGFLIILFLGALYKIVKIVNTDEEEEENE